MKLAPDCISYMKVTLLAVGLAFSAPAEVTFKHRFIDRDLPRASWGQTAFADLDKDGRLDFITGQSRGPIFWYRQEEAGQWIKYKSR